MNNQSNLTNLEKDIMEIIWSKEDISIAEIKFEMQDSHNIARETVKLYVKRLLQKELIGLKKLSQRNHRYFALMTKDEYSAGALDSFLKEHKGGLKHLVASMVRTTDFSDEEIAEVEQIIKEYKNKD